MRELERLVRQHLGDWRTGWSMGTFSAIAVAARALLEVSSAAK